MKINCIHYDKCFDSRVRVVYPAQNIGTEIDICETCSNFKTEYLSINSWRDVRKDLPKLCKPVLLYVILDNAEGYPYQIQGYLNLDGWHDCFGETLERDKVLAWQPLNLPPNFNITGG